MRTKALLSMAALAAGALTSMAQVYSANIVGYYNVTCPVGFTMTANQLQASPDNTVVSLFPNMPDNVEVWGWNGVSFAPNTSYGGQTWDDNSQTFNPGDGMFIHNVGGSSLTVTFVGQVPTGTLTKTLGGSPTFTLSGSIVPQAGNLETEMNLHPNQNDEVWFWNGVSYAPDTFYDVGTWDADPIVTVGQGWFYKNNAAITVTWTRTFNP
jgi:hypothetical protein